MDKLLRLKLEMVYRGMPIELVRQRFDEIKASELAEAQKVEVKPPIPVKRKLRVVK
jgi:hypothetical protein